MLMLSFWSLREWKRRLIASLNRRKCLFRLPNDAMGRRFHTKITPGQLLHSYLN